MVPCVCIFKPTPTLIISIACPTLVMHCIVAVECTQGSARKDVHLHSHRNKHAWHICLPLRSARERTQTAKLCAEAQVSGARKEGIKIQMNTPDCR